MSDKGRAMFAWAPPGQPVNSGVSIDEKSPAIEIDEVTLSKDMVGDHERVSCRRILWILFAFWFWLLHLLTTSICER